MEAPSPVSDLKQVQTEQVENSPVPDNEAAGERTRQKKGRVGLISKRQPQEEERGRKERNKERKERSRHRKLAGEPFTCQTPGSIVSGRHRWDCVSGADCTKRKDEGHF